MTLISQNLQKSYLVCTVCLCFTHRSLQEIQLDKHVKLLDSPGVIMVKESGDAASILLRNCVKVRDRDIHCTCTVVARIKLTFVLRATIVQR